VFTSWHSFKSSARASEIVQEPISSLPSRFCSEEHIGTPLQHHDSHTNLRCIKNTMNILLQPGQQKVVFSLHSPPCPTPTQKIDCYTTTKPKQTTTDDLPPHKQLKARSSNHSNLLTRLSPQPHEPKDGHHFLPPLQKISEAQERRHGQSNPRITVAA
jgi:hypothetical protein